MIEYLHKLRSEELNILFSRLRQETKNSNVLEIGSGTGFQLQLLFNYFREATGIDIAESNYASLKNEKITVYDGYNIPFGNHSFNYIFSSNVLEHIAHLDVMDKEFKRILKPNGICIHILPSHYWRFWTIITHYLKFIPALFLKNLKSLNVNPHEKSGANIEKHTERNWGNKILNVLYPDSHGVKGNRITEIFYFHPDCWKKYFERNGWNVTLFPLGLFYTGHLVFGDKIGMNTRKKLSEWLGSACYAYILQRR